MQKVDLIEIRDKSNNTDEFEFKINGTKLNAVKDYTIKRDTIFNTITITLFANIKANMDLDFWESKRPEHQNGEHFKRL